MQAVMCEVTVVAVASWLSSWTSVRGPVPCSATRIALGLWVAYALCAGRDPAVTRQTRLDDARIFARRLLALCL